MTTGNPSGRNRRPDRPFASAVLALLVAAPAFAGSGSWVFLQEGTEESLVRLSADGRSLTPIAKGFAGLGLALDGSGNYIVAAGKSLLRVTRAGVVSQIAAAPARTSWTRVAVDASGNFIAADGMQTVLWRVSADGASVVNFASFGTCCPEYSEDAPATLALAIDASGDYLILARGRWFPPGMNPLVPKGIGPEYFYRITPDGSVTEVPLTGVKLKEARSMVPDGKGSYLVADTHSDNAVFRLSLDGHVSKAEGLEIFGPLSPIGTWGAARNPDTGETMVIEFHGGGEIYRSAGEGQGLARVGQHLKLPLAVVWDPGR